MTAWSFILGAYVVTVVVIAVEVMAVRARCKAARAVVPAHLGHPAGTQRLQQPAHGNDS